MIPYVPSGRGLEAHLQNRVERYEKRASKPESLVAGVLCCPEGVVPQLKGWQVGRRPDLPYLHDYTNEWDREKLSWWLEGNRGRCLWDGLGYRVGDDERGSQLRRGETPRPDALQDDHPEQARKETGRPSSGWATQSSNGGPLRWRAANRR